MSAEQFLEDLIERIAARVAERIPQQPATAQPNAQQPAEYLTTRQAAKALALGASTLELWRARGTGPAWIKVGSAIRYSRTDLDAWLAAHRRKTK